MRDKSSKKSFNKSNSLEIPEISIKETSTHHELVFKIERSKPFFKHSEDYKQLEKILKNYISREGTKHIVRAKRDQVFRMGKQGGVSPGTSLTDLYKGDGLIDEQHRKKIEQEVKGLYRKNFSVLSIFKPLSNPEDKIVPRITKQETIRMKIPHQIKNDEQKKSGQKHFKVTERFGYSSGSKNQTKSKTPKDNQRKYDVTNRFNMGVKVMESSNRPKNFNVLNTVGLNKKGPTQEKGMYKYK